MKKKEIVEKIRIVEISQNSWAEENLTLLTTLTDEQITIVLDPLLEEERASDSLRDDRSNPWLSARKESSYAGNWRYVWDLNPRLRICTPCAWPLC